MSMAKRLRFISKARTQAHALEWHRYGSETVAYHHDEVLSIYKDLTTLTYDANYLVMSDEEAVVTVELGKYGSLLKAQQALKDYAINIWAQQMAWGNE